MRYVIIRDDDTNALTPVDCLERLYRPFLDRGLPINLAVIPDVATATTMPDGKPEGFLLHKNGHGDCSLPIGSNAKLTNYLKSNSGYHVVQHGYRHDYLEFERISASDAADRLDRGTRLLQDAGFSRPETFVAPYDKLSRANMLEIARRFRILSTGWFELGRIPYAWWPQYLMKKSLSRPHWRVGNTVLLSHPGCLLSYTRSYTGILDTIIQNLNQSRVMVLVTHWWEYFRNHHPDDKFIASLHETASYLSNRRDVKVVPFSELTGGRLPLN